MYGQQSLPGDVNLCPQCGLPDVDNAMWQSCQCPTEADEDEEPWTPDDGCYHCGNHQGDERYAAGEALCERCETTPWTADFPAPPINGCPCPQCKGDTARKEN